jgi:hypothetical protein
MVRATKTSADKAPATPVISTSTKSKKTKSVEAVVSETQVESVPVVAPVDGEVVESNVAAKLSEYSDKITQLTTLASSLKAEFKALEKSVAKELKAAQKAS